MAKGQGNGVAAKAVAIATAAMAGKTTAGRPQLAVVKPPAKPKSAPRSESKTHKKLRLASRGFHTSVRSIVGDVMTSAKIEDDQLGEDAGAVLEDLMINVVQRIAATMRDTQSDMATRFAVQMLNNATPVKTFPILLGEKHAQSAVLAMVRDIQCIDQATNTAVPLSTRVIEAMNAAVKRFKEATEADSDDDDDGDSGDDDDDDSPRGATAQSGLRVSVLRVAYQVRAALGAYRCTRFVPIAVAAAAQTIMETIVAAATQHMREEDVTAKRLLARHVAHIVAPNTSLVRMFGTAVCVNKVALPAMGSTYIGGPQKKKTTPAKKQAAVLEA